MKKKNPSILVKIIYIVISITILNFILLPVVNIFYTGLYNEKALDNFINYYPDILKHLFNSFKVSIPVTLIAVIFGIISSITLWRIKFFGRKLMRVLILFPLINPPFVGSVAFIMLFGRRGLITNKILNLSVSPFGIHGIIIMQSIAFSTLAYLIISSSIKRININYENASRNLGASEFITFFKVTLPTMKPEIAVAGMLVFLSSMADFGTPLIIGGNFQTLSSYLYIQVTGRFNMQLATLAGIFLLIPCLLAFFIHNYYSNKNNYIMEWYEEKNIEYQNMNVIVKYLLISITSAFAFFVTLKYGFIVIGAFTENWGHDYSFTLRHLKTALQSNLQPFLNSLKLALGVSFFSSSLGVFLAYLIKFRKLKFSRTINFISSIPAAIPGILFGIAYLITFKFPLFGIGKIYFKSIDERMFILLGTGIIIYIICIYRYLYVGLKSGYAYIENMNPNLELASNNLGAGDIKTFTRVIFPILKPAFSAAFLRNFTSTMTTLGAIIFLLLPQNRVAVQQIFQILSSSTIGAGAAMGLILSILSLLTLTIFKFLLNYNKKNIF